MFGAEHGEPEVGELLGRTVAGRYVLLRVIGAGGMASVYEAHDDAGCPCAVKVLHPTLAPVSRREQRLWREARVARAISHPGVVQVFDVGIDPELGPFLVMELLRGHTLGRLQRRAGGRLPVSQLYDHADALLSALESVHAEGFIHRDIKPDNIFIAEAGLKLLDFGVARANAQDDASSVDTQPGTMLGTPAFMPQEQARGSWSEVDARSDVWAVGATLFSLATDRFVHAGGTRNEQLGRAMTLSAPALLDVDPNLPEGFARVVDRALCFSPGDRFQSAGEMRAALSLARAGGMPEARPVSRSGGPTTADTLQEPPVYARAGSGTHAAGPHDVSARVTVHRERVSSAALAWALSLFVLTGAGGALALAAIRRAPERDAPSLFAGKPAATAAPPVPEQDATATRTAPRERATAAAEPSDRCLAPGAPGCDRLRTIASSTRMRAEPAPPPPVRASARPAPTRASAPKRPATLRARFPSLPAGDATRSSPSARGTELSPASVRGHASELSPPNPLDLRY